MEITGWACLALALLFVLATVLVVTSLFRGAKSDQGDMWSEMEAYRKSAEGEGHSAGAPLEFRCASCGKMLHGGTGGTVLGGIEVVTHMFMRAKRCPCCGKIFCGECSIKADNRLGRPEGAVDYTCPFCRTTGISG